MALENHGTFCFPKRAGLLADIVLQKMGCREKLKRGFIIYMAFINVCFRFKRFISSFFQCIVQIFREKKEHI